MMAAPGRGKLPSTMPKQGGSGTGMYQPAAGREDATSVNEEAAN